MGKENILFVIRLALTAVLLFLAVRTDIKSRKVLNKHTLPAALAGLVLCFIGSWKEALVRILIIAAEIFSSVFGLMGMGDLKLLIALTAIWGFYPVLVSLLVACLVMGLYALVTNTSEFRLALINIKNHFLYRTPLPVEGKTKYPFAVFICAGFCLTLLLHHAGAIDVF